MNYLHRRRLLLVWTVLSVVVPALIMPFSPLHVVVAVVFGGGHLLPILLGS